MARWVRKLTLTFLVSNSFLLPTGCNRAEVKDKDRFSEAVAPKILGVCTQCHANGKAERGFGYVDDVQKMIDRGKIAPGNAAGSRIAQKVSEDWGGGRRMPLRGPYFGPGLQEELNRWIDEDLFVGKEGVEWQVEIVNGSGVVSEPVGLQTVADGGTLQMTLVVDPAESTINIGGTCSKGTLSAVSDGRASYETGKIKADCSVSITRTKPATGGGGDGGGGDGGGGDGGGSAQEFTVTIAPAYGTEAGADPNINAAATTKIVEEGDTATFEFTLRAGDVLSDDTAESIAGTCPKGPLVLTNAGARTYSYTTGLITAACSVVVRSSNPCPTVATGITFGEVNTVLTGGSTVSCTSCHYAGSGDVDDAVADFGAGQNGSLDHTKITTTTASNGKKLIKGGAPLESAIYMQIDPVLNYRSRMPFEEEYIGLQDRSKVCNWIFDGATDN